MMHVFRSIEAANDYYAKHGVDIRLYELPEELRSPTYEQPAIRVEDQPGFLLGYLRHLQGLGVIN